MIAVIVVVPKVVVAFSVSAFTVGTLVVDFGSAAKRRSDLTSCVVAHSPCYGSYHRIHTLFLVPAERVVIPFRFAWLCSKDN